MNMQITTKPREGTFLWLLKIATAVLIFIIVAVHLKVNHDIQGLLSHEQVVQYYQSPLVLIMEGLFLITVLTHSLLGLRSIVMDLNPSKGVMQVLDFIFVAAGIGFTVYGIWLLRAVAAWRAGG